MAIVLRCDVLEPPRPPSSLGLCPPLDPVPPSRLVGPPPTSTLFSPFSSDTWERRGTRKRVRGPQTAFVLTGYRSAGLGIFTRVCAPPAQETAQPRPQTTVPSHPCFSSQGNMPGSGSAAQTEVEHLVLHNPLALCYGSHINNGEHPLNLHSLGKDFV